jgi:putative toxin-antitoxin system antitoxin component (TIGR02293 family)
MSPAAIADVLGGTKTLSRQIDYPSELTTLTREGLPVEALSRVATELSVERRTVARVVGISERTLNRRIAKNERLSAVESDRLVRLARVVANAVETLGTNEKASLWLKTPNRALDGMAPLQLLDTEAGVGSVETVLGRIAYGIYS